MLEQPGPPAGPTQGVKPGEVINIPTKAEALRARGARAGRAEIEGVHPSCCLRSDPRSMAVDGLGPRKEGD